MSQLKLEKSWMQRIEPEFQKDYMKSLESFLKSELEVQKEIFPEAHQYFAALNITPFENVKVVIIGQDPYHGPGQAHGLSFSVQDGIRFPPSLQNIFKELQSDLNLPKPTTGNLQKWAEQGVLLLNAVLTVESGKAASHQGKGWEQFTDRIIQALNQEKEHLVFILWGSYAQKKGVVIDRNRHLVLECVHPSPLSSHRGFFGSKPFSKTNAYLNLHQIEPIDWSLT